MITNTIARAAVESTYVIGSDNHANQKNWIFLLDQISPSASSIRVLGTRLKEIFKALNLKKAIRRIV